MLLHAFLKTSRPSQLDSSDLELLTREIEVAIDENEQARLDKVTRVACILIRHDHLLRRVLQADRWSRKCYLVARERVPPANRLRLDRIYPALVPTLPTPRPPEMTAAARQDIADLDGLLTLIRAEADQPTDAFRRLLDKGSEHEDEVFSRLLALMQRSSVEGKIELASAEECLEILLAVGLARPNLWRPLMRHLWPRRLLDYFRKLREAAHKEIGLFLTFGLPERSEQTERYHSTLLAIQTYDHPHVEEIVRARREEIWLLLCETVRRRRKEILSTAGDHSDQLFDLLVGLVQIEPLYFPELYYSHP